MSILHPSRRFVKKLLILGMTIVPISLPSISKEVASNDFGNMPTEYLQILEIVNRIALSNDLGKKKLSFTINAGAHAGLLGMNHSGNEDSFYYYSSLNPYKKYDDPIAAEIIRQAVIYGNWNASAYPNGTIAISYASFRLASHVEIACTIAHEIAHVIESHSFEESMELGDFAGVALVNQEDLSLSQRQLSRRYEKLADSRAWVLLNNAGYPPNACVSTLVALHKSAGTGSPTTPLSTHPGFHDRMDALQKFISRHSSSSVRRQEKHFEEPNFSFDPDLSMLTFEF